MPVNSIFNSILTKQKLACCVGVVILNSSLNCFDMNCYQRCMVVVLIAVASDEAAKVLKHCIEVLGSLIAKFLSTNRMMRPKFILDGPCKLRIVLLAAQCLNSRKSQNCSLSL